MLEQHNDINESVNTKLRETLTFCGLESNDDVVELYSLAIDDIYDLDSDADFHTYVSQGYDEHVLGVGITVVYDN